MFEHVALRCDPGQSLHCLHCWPAGADWRLKALVARLTLFQPYLEIEIEAHDLSWKAHCETTLTVR